VRWCRRPEPPRRCRSGSRRGGSPASRRERQ
jgi:hypothetical protein